MASRRSLIHHRRADDGSIKTAAYESGVVALNPPGLELDIADMFAGVSSQGEHAKK
jgi:hypothetical protein